MRIDVAQLQTVPAAVRQLDPGGDLHLLLDQPGSYASKTMGIAAASGRRLIASAASRRGLYRSQQAVPRPARSSRLCDTA
jgi:hypothetical protein